MACYLDHNATTHLDPRVLEAMLPYLSGPAANPSSLHRYGRIARDAIEAARVQLARLVGCMPAEIIWTSGGTEANNLAIQGIAAAWTQGRPPARMLYGATEHPSVMETAEALRRQRWAVEAIATGRDGLVDWAALEAQLAGAPVALLSLMRANNETGVVQDVVRAARLADRAGASFHVDAVQALGKLPLDFAAIGAGLMSISSHKIYGPKGAGALIVRADTEVATLLHGGAQERGRRGGTENVAAIVGFGAAAELAQAEMDARIAHSLRLRMRLEAGLRGLGGVTIFGEIAPRLSNTVQFALPGYEGEALLMQLDRHQIAVSSGSACASGRGEPSHVLLAMGIDRDTAYGAVRVSFGQHNTEADVDRLLATLQRLAVAA